MNFLSICQKVDVLSGLQGNVQTVEKPIGGQAVLVEGVRDGFLDLQNDRMTWEWMRRMAEFALVPAQQEYTPTYAVPPPAAPLPTDPYNLFGRWQKKHPMISYRVQDPDTLKWAKMIFVDYREFRHHLRNQTATGKPRYVTAHEQNNNLLLHPVPDKAYTMQADYFVEPQILQFNTNSPILPSRFHMLLVYRGLERLANHYGNNGLYGRYSVADAKLLGSLYRDQCPGETVTIRAVA